MDKGQIILLKDAPGERQAWKQPPWKVYLWALVEYFIITNPLQVSSRLRIVALRLFGSKIGSGVIFRPRTRVKFPWNLQIGNDCWIGEGVWFHNQDRIEVGNDVVISQEVFLTNGSHAHRRDMALLTAPIEIESGVWITSRCIVLGGSHIGTNALVSPGTVVRGVIPPNVIISNPPIVTLGQRHA